MMLTMGSRIGFVAYRAVTCPLRMMPAFIVIGTHRGGTSAFYHYLTEHPSIGAATTKEVNYFDRNYFKGSLWYRAHFPTRAQRANRAAFISGEASPHYLFHPLVPQRVAQTIPDVRLIALLRNPVERAWSHYRRYIYLGRETLPFEEAIAEEERRLSEDPYDTTGSTSYLARGLYANQLERWYSLFSPAQMLILRSEDFYADPAAILAQTLDFLEMPRDDLPEATAYDHYDGYAGPAAQSGETRMSPETRARLSAWFAPHNQRLYDELGRDMGWE
jgi:hypothetical protein